MWTLCVLSALMKSPVQTVFPVGVYISSDNLTPFALAIHDMKALLESWAHSKHRAWTFTNMFLSNTLRLQLYCRYSVYSINIMWGTRKIKKHKRKVKQRLACLLLWIWTSQRLFRFKYVLLSRPKKCASTFTQKCSHCGALIVYVVT